MSLHLLSVSSSAILGYLFSQTPSMSFTQRVYGRQHLSYYLPYKVYMVLITMRVVRLNTTVFATFTVASFLNRCLNPFIYASQYEVMRRSWISLIDFLRRHVARKPAVAAAAIRIEPMPSSSAPPSNPAGQHTSEP